MYQNLLNRRKMFYKAIFMLILFLLYSNYTFYGHKKCLQAD